MPGTTRSSLHLLPNLLSSASINGMIISIPTARKKLVTSPALIALLIYLLVLTVTWEYGRRHFLRDPLSIFFNEKRGYEPLYGAQRRHEAEDFIQDAQSLQRNPHAPDVVGNETEARICASFITIGRQIREQYLRDALGSFLADLTPAERETVHLKVLFADPDPARQHPLYKEGWLHSLVDESYTYFTAGLSQNDQNYATSLAQIQLLNAKTIFDYSLALSHCLETTSAPYIAIFEDDILFARGWLAQTLLALQEGELMMADPRRRDPEPTRIENGRSNQFLYLRLFNQERSMGWGGRRGFFSNNAHWITLGIDLPLYLLMRRLRRSPHAARTHIDGWFVAVICGLAVPTFVWLFFAAGKASLVPPKPGVREEFFGCCSQALVFKREWVPNLIAFLREQSNANSEGRCDMLTRDFAYVWGLARLSGYPMVVQHVGLKSASHTTARDAQAVTSMAFEYLNDLELKGRHIKMLSKLFGERKPPETPIL